MDFLKPQLLTSMAFVWTLGVAGLISKGAFQCPQLYFENRIENAIKVKTRFENLVSKQDSKRDQKRPRNGLETFTVIIPIEKRLQLFLEERKGGTELSSNMYHEVYSFTSFLVFKLLIKS